MTCESMRELLLTADLEELKGEGAGLLAEHLRGCAVCRADAARIVRSTARLGEAVSSRRRRRTAAILTPFALAAGVVLFVMTYPTTTVVTPAARASIAGAPVV